MGAMRIEFLGTGGAITTPRPGCDCHVCVEARARGIPYSRSGPSLFVHGPDVLIDTPEEIKDQLNRSRIGTIAGCFYSHWHPDHTMGRRVWEALNHDWRGTNTARHRTPIYLPQQVGQDFRRRLGTWDHLTFMERQGMVRLVELSDGEIVTLGGTRIEPFRLAEDYVYGFLFADDRHRVLIVPDELNNWTPPPELRGVDLAVLPMGVVEFDPLSGERRIAADHPLLKAEATFAETLEVVRRLEAKRVVLTHIEEMDELSYDELERVRARLHDEGLDIEFAYDTLLIDLD